MFGKCKFDFDMKMMFSMNDVSYSNSESLLIPSDQNRQPVGCKQALMELLALRCKAAVVLVCKKRN